MKNKELFDACTKQCVWCYEQWPVVATKGQMLHVGPYTKDKELFSTPCKATTIREAFEYVGYKGGKKVEWKAPMPRKLGALRKTSSPNNRKFWRNVTECSLSVSEWPDWKRSMGSKKSTPEEVKRMREELRHYDALDYWASKECTEGFQYRPSLDKGRITEPVCNWGLGCTTCWERHETYEKKLQENFCD